MPSLDERLESTRLVGEAMVLQLAADDGPLDEIDLLLGRAIALWPDNLDALQEAGHFYDAVVDDQEKAIKYADLCRTKAAALVAEMDEILLEHQGHPRDP